MAALTSLLVLSLFAFGASADDDLIGDGKCITITDGDLVVHERKPGQLHAYYLYVINRGQEDDDQRWILESVGRDFYKLKNKHSNRRLAIGAYDFLLTASDEIRMMDHFKFRPDGAGKFDIISRGNLHLKIHGEDNSVKQSTDQQHWTVEKCQD
uniref:Erythema protein SVEP-2 n=1 Tax=Simulium nigrimanum TaxID=683695 RepID=D1FPS6_SIMNI